MLELLPFDGVGLATLIRKREVSARELIEAAMARIDRLDGTLNALTTRTYERALSRAESIPSNAPFAGGTNVIKRSY